MIERLERLVDEVAALHSKLILVVGPPHSGKSALLETLANNRGAPLLRLGSELGSRLAVVPQKRRQLQSTGILRDLADLFAKGDLLLLDNTELLFDRSLQLDPLDLLKQLARARRVVAVCPGQLSDGRLTYAEMGHPEHQDYGLAGFVPFVMQ